MNLLNILVDTVHRVPSQKAIVSAKGTFTFEELLKTGLGKGKEYREKGIKKGDAVLVLVPMSAALYVTLIGLWSIGGVPMFFDPGAGKEHIRDCCVRMAPKGMVGGWKAQILRWMVPELRKIPTVFLPGTKAQNQQNERITYEELEGGFPALVTFTSGSTGKPKGAVRTHDFLLAQYQVLKDTLGYKAEDVELATLPIFALCNLASGITTLIPDINFKRMGDYYASRVTEQIRTAKVTRITAAPAFMKRLAAELSVKNGLFQEVEGIYTGGGPVFPSLMSELKKIFPNARLMAVYGSTEAEPIAELDWDTLTEQDFQAMKAGAGLPAGTPVSATACKIIPDQWGTALAFDSEEQLEAGFLKQEVGEIIVTGAHVLKGYLGGEQEDMNKIRAESQVWHRTGDLGRFDEAGRLWILGRAGAVIRDQQGVLYPFCVESALDCGFNGVKAALVQLEGKRVLVVETEAVPLEQLKPVLSWAGIEEYRSIRRIPMDARHGSKVDYPALMKLLKNE